jgi:hypothetical protein
MVAAAIASRPLSQPAPTPLRRSQRSAGTWVIIGVPVLLGLVFVWQLASNLLHTEIAVRSAVAISRVSLESDPLGSRVDLVLVDRVGQETTFDGNMTIKLREPDGTLWQTTRGVTATDFVPLPSGGLLAGRVGYSVIIPSTDWMRAPRRGGAATISVDVVPTDGTAFSTVAEERFP